MEIKYKLYPYPVLWNKNDDYKMPSEFSAEIKTEENFKNTKLKIEGEKMTVYMMELC